ncbi:MAG: prolipoprotein diacylglyceryl transferase [Desulfovibrionales bacterium]
MFFTDVGFLTTILWNVSPVLVHIGPVPIRWYGLLFALGFLFGYAFMHGVYRREGKPLSDLDRLFFVVMAGALLGARLGEVLFYNPSYFFHHPLEIVMIWNGGLASHGGIAGIFIALWIYARKRPDQPFLWLLDRICIPAMIGAALIRLGNLFNSEILGTPTHVPWAFVFVQEDLVPRHPVQLYEAGSYLLVFLVLLRLYRIQALGLPSGLLLGSALLASFLTRFFLEFLKLRQAAFGAALPLSIGQILSIPIILLGAFLLVRAVRKKNGFTRR